MRPEPPSARLVHLLSRLSDDSLSPDEAQDLESILIEDRDARDYYRWHSTVHVALEERGRNESFEPAKVIRPSFGRRVLWGAAAAAVISVGLFLWRGGVDDMEPGKVAGQDVEPVGPIVAVVSAAEGVRWSAESSAEAGTRLPAGRLRVDDGSLWLSLSGGQSVYLRGPAEVELIDREEFGVVSGQVAFRSGGKGSPFIVHLPEAAVVDRASEFGVTVRGERAGVRAFSGQLKVCTLGPSGRTREELVLEAGSEIGVGRQFSVLTPGTMTFLREAPLPRLAGSSGSPAYQAAVKRSEPHSFWRFEEVGPGRVVPDEMGGSGLMLVEGASLAGKPDHRYLLVDDASLSGFAMAADRSFEFRPDGGFSVECLFYSTGEQIGSILSMETTGGLPEGLTMPRTVRHAPHYFLLERMGRRGEKIDHVHPDFALRGLFRAPAGYEGGLNTYSRESHLFHRWVHAAAIYDGDRIRIYVDGQLSDEVPASLVFSGVGMRPIIGRLQPQPTGERRQWVGGIDEVALYGRPLSEGEVRDHFRALAR